jgi:hypothetical protein
MRAIIFSFSFFQFWFLYRFLSGDHMPMKKLIALTFAVSFLSACAEKPVAAESHASGNTKQPIFMKDNVSDRQMVRDLNQCAHEAFIDTAGNGAIGSDTQKKCMSVRGYDISYN